MAGYPGNIFATIRSPVRRVLRHDPSVTGTFGASVQSPSGGNVADPPGYPRELERDVVLRERRRDGAVF